MAKSAAGVWMTYCMVAYVYVMYSMGQMLQSAISESADSSQRRGLFFIYYGTVIIWSTFVVVWFGQELRLLSLYNAEMGNMLANFSAKVETNPLQATDSAGLSCDKCIMHVLPLQCCLMVKCTSCCWC